MEVPTPLCHHQLLVAQLLSLLLQDPQTASYRRVQLKLYRWKQERVHLTNILDKFKVQFQKFPLLFLSLFYKKRINSLRTYNENLTDEKKKSAYSMYTHSTLLNHCCYSKRHCFTIKYEQFQYFHIYLDKSRIRTPCRGPFDTLSGLPTPWWVSRWRGNFRLWLEQPLTWYLHFLWGQFLKNQTNNKHYSEIRHIFARLFP